MTSWTDNRLAWVQSATQEQINAVIAVVSANGDLDETRGDRAETADAIIWLATRGERGAEWGNAAKAAEEVGGYAERKTAHHRFREALRADRAVAEALVSDAATLAEAETLHRILDIVDEVTDPATAARIADRFAEHVIRNQANAATVAAMNASWAEKIREILGIPGDYTPFHGHLALGPLRRPLPRPVSLGFAGPNECHTTKGGIRVHVKPWCRCPQ